MHLLQAESSCVICRILEHTASWHSSSVQFVVEPETVGDYFSAKTLFLNQTSVWDLINMQSSANAVRF